MKKIGIYPGCCFQGADEHNYKLIVDFLDKMEVEGVLLDRAACCGGGVIDETNKTVTYALNARNIALAEEKGVDLYTPCNTCYMVIAKSKLALDRDPELKAKVNEILAEEGLEYKGEATIYHTLNLLRDFVGLDEYKKKIVRKLEGVKVAPYYGCHVLSPEEISLDDPEIIGRYEARTNRLITKEYVDILKKQGKKNIIVRDPMTCECKDGICQLCYGHNAMGKLPEIGHNIGIETGQTVSEKATQLVLSTKHNIQGKIKSAIPTGFEAQKILLNTPDNYRGKATVATIDGVVSKVTKLPTGGWNIYIADTPHFVGAEVKPTVKVGDQVTKGQIISSGLASPKEIMQYGGVLQARRYVRQKLFEANDKSIDKRVFGVIARGYLELAKKKGDVYHQLHRYDALVKDIDLPQTTTVAVHDKQIVNKFLAEPFLHYSIGTKITPAIVKKLKEHGIKEIKVSHNPAPIEAVYKTYEQKPLAKETIWQKLNYRGIKKGLTHELLYNEGVDIDELHSDRAKYTLGKL